MLLCLSVQLIHIDRLAILNDYMTRLYLWKVRLPQIHRTGNSHWDNRAFGAGGNLETALMEWKKIGLFFILIPCALRENTDGNSGFYLLNSCKDGLQALLDICTVKEKTVQILHPAGKKRYLFKLFFGYIAGKDRTSGVCKGNVKKAAVIANVKDRCVLRISQ